ncbi:MAG: hypothetical protein COA65_04465 [Rhodospirillaceae bacterium]|nr:MAG: hypothetical protein COA65_04465 [Rhodospirillaceae bacterium]
MPDAPKSESAPQRRVLELSYSHVELFRAFQRIFDPLPVCIQGTGLTVTDGKKKIVVALGEERERRLGAEFKLPETTIDFAFHGYSEDEANAILNHFILRTRRGGG